MTRIHLRPAVPLDTAPTWRHFLSFAPREGGRLRECLRAQIRLWAVVFVCVRVQKERQKERGREVGRQGGRESEESEGEGKREREPVGSWRRLEYLWGSTSSARRKSFLGTRISVVLAGISTVATRPRIRACPFFTVVTFRGPT